MGLSVSANIIKIYLKKYFARFLINWEEIEKIIENLAWLDSFRFSSCLMSPETGITFLKSWYTVVAYTYKPAPQLENIPWWGKNILWGGEVNERLGGKIY